MTTRSGRRYHEEKGNLGITEIGIADLVKTMIEDHKVREAQWEEEQRRLRKAADLERAQMREQMEMLRQFVGETRRADETRTVSHTGSRTSHEGEVKLVKLSDQDDIEAHLTTFERVMRAYEVKEERWAVKLAPQLTGKAQQAYAAMSTEQAGDYEALKKAILRRYDTSEETYRQRFRAATKKEDEVVSELAVRLNDLLQKWTKTCMSADEVRDRVVQEQLLNSLPMDIRIWVGEHRPKTAAEAAELADNYLRARKQERTSGVVGDPRRERKPWHKADAEGRGDRGALPKAPWQDEGKKKETAQCP